MDSFPSGWKISNHLPLWSIILGSLKYQTLIYEFRVPQVLCPFFVSLGGWWDTSTLILCALGHASLSCLNPNLALLHISRIPGLWESPGILVQFSFWVPQRFSPLKAGLNYFFLCFVRSNVCPFIGLGPFLLTFNGFGLCLFIESPSGS